MWFNRIIKFILYECSCLNLLQDLSNLREDACCAGGNSGPLPWSNPWQYNHPEKHWPLVSTYQETVMATTELGFWSSLDLFGNYFWQTLITFLEKQDHERFVRIERRRYFRKFLLEHFLLLLLIPERYKLSRVLTSTQPPHPFPVELLGTPLSWTTFLPDFLMCFSYFSVLANN